MFIDIVTINTEKIEDGLIEKNKDIFLKSGRKNVDKLTIALSEAELSNGDKIYTMTINGKDSTKNFLF